MGGMGNGGLAGRRPQTAPCPVHGALADGGVEDRRLVRHLLQTDPPGARPRTLVPGLMSSSTLILKQPGKGEEEYTSQATGTGTWQGTSWIQAVQGQAQGNRLPVERLLGRDVPVAAGQGSPHLERVHEGLATGLGAVPENLPVVSVACCHGGSL